MLSVSEISQEIETNLDFLTTSLRDIPERHRSLRAVFEYSCKLLSKEDCEVLCKLSLFRTGFTRDAATRVASATLDTLSSLIGKSFLYRSETGRYYMHDVIRSFASEKLLADGKYQETSEKFLETMLALTLEAQEQLRGSRQTEWLGLLEREFDNLRTALEWAFSPNASRERIEQGLQLVMSIIRFLQARGYVREGITWLERGLDERITVSPAIRAKALGLAGWLAIYSNDSQRARNLLGESIAIYRQMDDRSGLAKALDNLGDIAWFMGDYAESKACYDESLSMLRKIGDPCSIGLSLYSIGRLHVDYGFYHQAQANFQEALSLLKAIPDLRGVAMCTNGLGRLALFQDHLEEALHHFREAVRMNYELGHKIALAECLRELAVVAHLMEQEPRAIQLWAAATRLQKSLDIAFPPNDPINHKIPENWIELITSSSDWIKGHTLSFEHAIEYAISF
jgi:tetratricopeptide (TPR) repeat protein